MSEAVDTLGDDENDSDNAASSSSSAADTATDDDDDDDDDDRRKTELWEQWWFEARNAQALEVLVRMPGADINAKTKSRIDPRAQVAWIPGGHTAVTLAAQRDDPESIALLASLGADLNARDDNGAAPIHHAAHADATRATEALLNAGADPNVQDDRDGSTAAILAAYGMRRETLRYLISRHPEVDLTLRDVGE